MPRAYPFGPPDRLEIDPGYAWVREHEPLARVRMAYGEPAWLVTRYDDVRMVYTDPRFSRAMAVNPDVPRPYPEPIAGGISDLDPPDHTRLRRLVGQAFTARRTERLRPRVEEITAGLLDRMVAGGPPADLVEALAVALPSIVVCELLGVPYGDRDTFRTWTDSYMTTTGLPIEDKLENLGRLGGYLGELAARRREHPTDDLIGALVRARDERDQLTEPELVGFTMTLLAAGYETTASQIANFTYTLLTHPDQLALLRAGAVDVADAVEELLRYVPLTAGTILPRYARADVELSGGTVRAGEPVFGVTEAADRDPRVFADPDRLDLARAFRPDRPHLAFALGTHFCTGAQLARTELRAALTALLGRCPDLRLAVPTGEVAWKDGTVVRGPVALPVAW
ncbi:MAG: cytochrome P450 [Mycobacteriales bacterium]